MSPRAADWNAAAVPVYWSTDFRMPISVADPEGLTEGSGPISAVFRRWTHLYKVRGVTIEIRSLIGGPTRWPRRMSRVRSARVTAIRC